MAPLFTELLKGDKVASTPEFFNRWMVPLGLALLATLAMCLVVRGSLVKTLNRDDLRLFLRHAAFPTGVGILIAGIGTTLLGAAGIAPAAALFLIGVAATGIIREVARILSGANPFTAGRRRRLGAHIVHLSVVLLFLGFTGTAYTTENSKLMKPGETMAIGDFALEFEGLREENDYRKYAIYSDILVRKAGWTVGTYTAARMFYHSHPKQPTSEVAIRTTLADDLFLILGRINNETGEVAIKAVINPLVAWIWIGGIVLIIGTLLGLVRMPERSDRGNSNTRFGLTLIYLTMPMAAVIIVAILAEPPDTALTLAGCALVGTVILFGNAVYQVALTLERRS
jgi:cytochrome c-type biogenesis protein CcmF